MTEILNHYKTRFSRILTYTNTKWYYLIAKTLCVIIGLPLYVLLLPVDVVFFLLYALFAVVPFINVFMLFVCKVVGIICGVGYYVGILPDCKKYYALYLQELQAERVESEDAMADDDATANSNASADGFSYQMRDASPIDDQPTDTNASASTDASDTSDLN